MIAVTPTWLLLVGFAWGSSPSASGANAGPSPLQLRTSFAGKAFDHFAIKDNRITATTDGAAVVVPPNATWELAGDLRSQVDLVRFAPNYRIVRRPHPADAADAAPAFTAIIQTEHGDAWTDGKLKGGILVHLWIVDGRIDQVRPVPALMDAGKGKFGSAFHTIELDASNVRGAPATLLLVRDRFVAPTPFFRHKAADAALSVMYLGSPDEFVTTVQTIKSFEAITGTFNTYTLAGVAAAGGFTPALAHLLARGASPNAPPATHHSPVFLAARNGRDDALRVLLNARAQPTTLWGDTTDDPFQVALIDGHLDLAAALMADDASRPAPGLAIRAAQLGRTDILQQLVATGQVKSLSILPPVTLATAALHGDEALLTFALARGATISESASSFPLLGAAAFDGNRTIVAMLLQTGAKIDAVDADGNTALQWATRAGATDIGADLIAAGADVNHANTAGATALHDAAAIGALDAVTMLLAQGARPDVATGSGDTPLELALATQSKAVVAALVKAGARLDPAHSRFTAALYSALAIDAVDVLKGAQAAGWQPATPFDHEWTALAIADFDGAVDCSAWLSTLGVPPSITSVDPTPDTAVRPLSGTGPADPRPPNRKHPATTVRVAGLVDVDGRFRLPVILSCDDPRLVTAVLRSVESWRFAPAVKAGRPIASRVEIPVKFPAIDRQPFELDAVDVAPTIIRAAPAAASTTFSPEFSVLHIFQGQTNPVTGQTAERFPVNQVLGNNSIMDFKNEWATFSFVVETVGQPGDIELLGWDNLWFAEAALNALAKYTFTPATRAGRPVRTRISMTIQPDL